MFSFQELQTVTYLRNSFFELWSGTALFRSLIHFYSTIFYKFMIQGWGFYPNNYISPFICHFFSNCKSNHNRTLENGIIKGVEVNSNPKYRKKLPEQFCDATFINSLYSSIVNTSMDFFYKLQGFSECV